MPARYLRARRRQAVIGVITAISVLGVAAGVAALIIALAITNGMRRDLQDRLLGSTAHVDLMRISADGIRDWQPLLARLGRLPHVTAAAPGLYGQVLISRGARSGGGLIKGILPDQERKVTDLLGAVKEGSAETLEPVQTAVSDAGPKPPGFVATPPIVIGKDLAATLGAAVGDTVLVTSPQGDLTPLGLVPRYQRFQVVGIFNSGFYQYDSSYALTRLTDAQRLFSEPDLVSVISFKVDDLYRAKQIAGEIEEAAGAGVPDDQLDGAEPRAVPRAEAGAGGHVYRAGADCVCGGAEHPDRADHDGDGKDTRHRRDDELRGDARAGAARVPFSGIADLGHRDAFGSGLGYGVSLAGSHYHFIPLDASVYSIDSLPFAPRLVDALIVAGVSLGVSALATLYPSASAAGVLPAEALRYE